MENCSAWHSFGDLERKKEFCEVAFKSEVLTAVAASVSKWIILAKELIEFQHLIYTRLEIFSYES